MRADLTATNSGADGPGEGIARPSARTLLFLADGIAKDDPNDDEAK